MQSQPRHAPGMRPSEHARIARDYTTKALHKGASPNPSLSPLADAKKAAAKARAHAAGIEESPPLVVVHRLPDPPTPVESERETLGTYDLPDISTPMDEQPVPVSRSYDLQTGTASFGPAALGDFWEEVRRNFWAGPCFYGFYASSCSASSELCTRPVFVCLSLRTHWLYSIHA